MESLPKWVYKIMNLNLEKSWECALQSELKSEYYSALMSFLDSQILNGADIYPDVSNVFRCFDLTPIENVSVVILGQDPYHGAGQANGLCFSVNDGVPPPPSLRNIYKELESDLGMTRTGSDLSDWAGRGALLLNSVLTVERDKPASHANMGWEKFTDAVIRVLSKRKNLVYILWGAYAIKKAGEIDGENNLILTSAHPSPLSAYRGFFGNKHFSAANEYLKKYGKTPVF